MALLATIMATLLVVATALAFGVTSTCAGTPRS